MKCHIAHSGKSIGVYTPKTHFYIHRPFAYSGPNSGWGFVLRWQREGVWNHLRLMLHAKGQRPKGARGTRSYELCKWRSRRLDRGSRFGYKQFVRIKVGLGGPKPGEASVQKR